MRPALIICLAVICLAVLFPGAARAQERSHDALAQARAHATFENQRVLLLLTGGEEGAFAALRTALDDYRTLGKLVRYEYQLAGVPADSLAGRTLRERLDVASLALPALVVLDTDDQVLGSLDAAGMQTADGVDVAKVRSFLEARACTPKVARAVLAAGLAEAARTKRHAFVYLSAPW